MPFEAIQQPLGTGSSCADIPIQFRQLHHPHGALKLRRAQIVAEVHEKEPWVDVRVPLAPTLLILDLADPAVSAQYTHQFGVIGPLCDRYTAFESCHMVGKIEAEGRDASEAADG